MGEQARGLGARVLEMLIPQFDRHGREPPAEVAKQMLVADLTISLCQKSLAHSHARKKAPCRFLSLPEYSSDILDDPSIMVDYQAQAPTVYRFAEAFTNGSHIRVAGPAGTDVTLRIDSRVGNACPGFVRNPGDLGSPPDIEANVAPIENSANGVLVTDRGRLTVKDGIGYGYPFTDLRHRVCAECGVGLNPLAKLCGHMLIDEGVFGAVHFGFGSNLAHGGQNDTDFHLDFVVPNASLWVDNVAMLRDGKLC